MNKFEGNEKLQLSSDSDDEPENGIDDLVGKLTTLELDDKINTSKTTSTSQPISSRNKKDFQLSDFDHLQTVGTGTFGRVRLVQHYSTKKFYAMKICRKVDIVRLKQVDHIKNEKNILSTLNHPFIVNLFATFKDPGHLYFVFEYVCGGELFSHLRRAGRFPNDVARFFSSEIILALEHMHSFDIVYRDLKPENLLIDSTGHIKITDFGFAKVVRDRTWTLCGTPEYLAPEIIQSKGHGRAVDWWALGILIYEMLVGYPPFFDDNPFVIYEKILMGDFSFPGHVNACARDLIKGLLALDRTKRLGNLKAGAKDVKDHLWFASINWDHIYAKTVQSPIVPTCKKGEGDTSNFESYDDQDDDEEDLFFNPLADTYEKEFQDF
eukprot:TRINITY_DN7712_c0_g1_i1.p1 TRINITY_DN7712_c0_g1~~TRINITY_DN7712_c0_g1_i1.p1  ORF type:complete len:380 (-),score=72.83 TRINITY_DN7712_c0_g1_i1:221-1360(-)